MNYPHLIGLVETDTEAGFDDRLVAGDITTMRLLGHSQISPQRKGISWL
jgi:hypothetical protein